LAPKKKEEECRFSVCIVSSTVAGAGRHLFLRTFFFKRLSGGRAYLKT